MVELLLTKLKPSDVKDYRGYANTQSARAKGEVSGAWSHKNSNPPHKLGRHPFNIVTEKTYD